MNTIEKRFNKNAFYNDLATWDDDKEVNLWVLPKGSLCTLTNIAGVNVLQNGGSHICNSTIVDLLAEHGLYGDMLIDSVDNITPTIPRWIRYYMTEKTVKDFHDDASKISVTVLGPTNNIKPGLPISVKSLQPMRIKATDVKDTTRQLSRADHSINLFLVELDDGVRYTYEPHRRIRGVVTSYTEHGYIVSIRTGETVQVVDRVNAITKYLLELTGVSPKDVVGSTVELEYTSFTGNNRLRPYKAPIIVHIPEVRKLAVNGFGFDSKVVINRAELSILFNPKRPTVPSVITPTRLTETDTVKDEEGNILFHDRYTGEVVARLDVGKRVGELCVLSRVGNRVEHYTFSTVYDSDSLPLNSFNNVVGKIMWERFGILFISCGLYHEYEDKPMLGGSVIDYIVEDNAVVDVDVVKRVHAF